MKNLLRLFFIAFSLTISSCKISYIPNSFNSPLLRNKGDGQLNTQIGISGVEVQSAYAVTDNLGLILNGQIIKRNDKESELGIVTKKQTLFEGGIGYTEKFSDSGIFEFFAGGGAGVVPANFRTIEWTGPAEISYQRYFIQPAIGFFNEFIDFSVVSRLALVNMGPQKNWFYEPGAVLKIGYRRVRFVGNMGFSIPFRKYDERYWDNFPFTLSVGIHFNFGKCKLAE
ncbi:hypothetical protein [Tenuifilum thalassicum]|uniref:Outer membrane protein beta-barrel domain-containing protein n=1 Tax=Tenuifilum thalassicum TaxID=2590900 RepID=A0A7D3XNQ9_9BACT|nr:hypothetical protein [Tenuifilum thalassicum]QKG81096.1 hypothetical protein FHG85_12745 [Tenuifilum thalassicum]